MAIRYWHWLLTQKKNEPEPTEYKVRGTAEVNPDGFDFDPEYDYYDYEEDGLIINVEQDENT